MSAAVAYCALRHVIEEHESSVAIHVPLIVLPQQMQGEHKARVAIGILLIEF
jgi:hypothetical protein